MNQLNFQEMSDTELLTYVKQHPEDKQAFYVYVDRKRAASPQAVPMKLEDALSELEERIRNQK
jgi:hypothetical protein